MSEYKIINYSHSKLEIARSCWLKFKYQYIDHAKSVEIRDASDFGEVCHYISENYKGSGKAELLALYHEIINKNKITLVEDYKKRLPLALKNIHDHWNSKFKNLPEGTEIKKEDNIEIQLTESIKLNGKIDILIKYPTGNITITDLKTNKSNKYADHKNQLAMYMLLLNRKYKIPFENMETDIIYLCMLDSDKYGNKILNEGYDNIHKIYKLDEIDVECLLSEIITIDAQLKKNLERNSWKPKPSKFGCTYCKFNHMCAEKFI